ncbi:MAG: hypothetical protein AABY22_11075 [Nanoarchaeota archaeon]
MNKDNKQLLWIIAVIIVAVVGYSYFSDTEPKPFALLGRSIWIPQYWNGECVMRADHYQEIKKTTHTDTPTWYHCTTSESGKWIPIYPGVQCEYTITGHSSADVYICKGNTENVNDLKDTSKCISQRSFFRGDRDIYRVNAGDSIYINTFKAIQNADLYVKYPSYGIKIRQADGFLTATTTNCLLNSIKANDEGVVDLHTINLKDRIEIKPDIPFNVVSGLRPAISTQAVSIGTIESGYPIYISRPGFYHLIRKADDGFEYVDTRQEFQSSLIQCIPRTTGCNDNAQTVKLEEQSCDKFGGAITGYAPVQGDSTRLCKYLCYGDVLKRQNDCISIPSSCPADKPLFDTQTGQCVTLSEKTLQKPVCSSCFGWIWNKLSGDKYCISQPAKKVLGFIPVPFSSQEKICPYFLLILGALLLLGGLFGYNLYKKRKKK